MRVQCTQRAGRASTVGRVAAGPRAQSGECAHSASEPSMDSRAHLDAVEGRKLALLLSRALRLLVVVIVVTLAGVLLLRLGRWRGRWW